MRFMTNMISVLIVLTSHTFVNALRGTAQLTWYISYAPCCPGNPNYDPNADREECDRFSACSYSGDFWAIGHKSFDYVQSNNLVAFFDASDPNGNNFMTKYGGKQITLRKNGKTINALIADSCGDKDCNGCCSNNAQPSGLLIDMEYWTAINNFGSTDSIWGNIEFCIDEPTCNTPINMPPIDTVHDIVIKNQVHTQEWWVAFYILKENLSCGGSISNVEITDNNFYSNLWVPYQDNQWNYYSFPHFGKPFTAPITVRITRLNNQVSESIVGYNLVSLTGNQLFDFGSNFCV